MNSNPLPLRTQTKQLPTTHYPLPTTHYGVFVDDNIMQRFIAGESFAKRRFEGYIIHCTLSITSNF
jgi:hypothetical protein